MLCTPPFAPFQPHAAAVDAVRAPVTGSPLAMTPHANVFLPQSYVSPATSTQGNQVVKQIRRISEPRSVPLARDLCDTFDQAGLLPPSAHTHPHLSPVYAVDVFDGLATIRSPFYAKGNVVQYFASRPSTEKISALAQLASGISHLHSLDLTHGNVTPTNVLVDDAGNIRLTDVGVAVAVRREQVRGEGRVRVPDALAYMPRERLFPSTPNDPVPSTTAIDAYAFACTAYHLFTEKEPYRGRTPGAHISNVARDMHPLQQPSQLPDASWKILEPCFATVAAQRPSMNHVHDQLLELL